MDDGSYRPLRDLSGGKRVNLLLSLLLERPLVIDQPEDELDNRRDDASCPSQTDHTTHNADIVVKDADQVFRQLTVDISQFRGNRRASCPHRPDG